MGLFTSSSSQRRSSFLRLPSSPIDDDVPFIESSQAIDVHRFERKLNILIFTTGLLSMADIAGFVFAILSRDAWLKNSSTTMMSVVRAYVYSEYLSTNPGRIVGVLTTLV